jgi:3-hydroxyisobutyrate dehydrogenase-like beta-hydroxyacid dehydrogenase
MTDGRAVGVIGVGLLGQAFVHRLRSAGLQVMGFDVDPAKNASLAELGGKPAQSVADLAQRCDPLVLAVFSTDQVEAVVESEVLPALGEGSGESSCAPARVTPSASRRWVSAWRCVGCACWRRRSPARADR